VSPGSCSAPEDQTGEEYSAAVVAGGLVVAGGDRSPLLEPVEATLDDVALLVELGVEGVRTAGSASATTRELVVALGDSGLDPASA
jgi:hypothetical protein